MTSVSESIDYSIHKVVNSAVWHSVWYPALKSVKDHIRFTANRAVANAVYRSALESVQSSVNQKLKKYAF